MFTGIIEGLGTISAIRSSNQGKQFSIESDFHLEGTNIGDSVAINGACLTAVAINGRRFDVDVSPETLGISVFGRIKTGARVNLERALRLSDRLDGHLVSGHVDGTGLMKQKKNTGNAIIITYSVHESVARYMIKKGSVAVDGVSLTINSCSKTDFSVSIIPHTAKLTTIGLKKIGEAVNIETDMVGKYIERFVTAGSGKDEPEHKGNALDMHFLAKNGFL